MSTPTDAAVADVAKVMRVSNRSNVELVASSLANTVYEGVTVALRAVGAGAVNQAVKSCAIARTMAAQRGWEIVFVPGFDTIHFEDAPEGRSAITLRALVLGGPGGHVPST